MKTHIVAENGQNRFKFGQRISSGGYEMKNLNYENATHLLKCAHALGTHRFEYTMRCHILGLTKSRMRKILVFGDRYWKGAEHVKKIRYVPPWRLKAIKAG